MKTEHAATTATSISGAASILGSWQICHAICLAIISLLAAVGVSVTFMPLLWLSEIVVYVWSVAAALLLVVAALYYTKKCVTRGMLTLNTGLVVAGVPFFSQQQIVFWTLGGIITLAGAYLIYKDRRRKTCH